MAAAEETVPKKPDVPERPGGAKPLVSLEGSASIEVLLCVMKNRGMQGVDAFRDICLTCSLSTLGALGMFLPHLPALCRQLFAAVPEPLGALQAQGFYANIAVRAGHAFTPMPSLTQVLPRRLRISAAFLIYPSLKSAIQAKGAVLLTAPLQCAVAPPVPLRHHRRRHR